MTPEYYRRMKDLFLEARECELSARGAMLRERCADDPSLYRRIEAMLSASENVESFLGDADKAWIDELAAGEAHEHPERIGGYRVLDVLGEGAMGVVYHAEQETPIHRRVALKVFKPELDNRQVLARFAAEREALGMMNHPNVARVFDAGATPQGRPYFVMECVLGTSITEYCREHQLSTRDRLHLFVDVCKAVQHAHLKGIIHRDLKPSNVLVSEDEEATKALSHGATKGKRGDPSGTAGAQVKVIDFGVAKATMGKLIEESFATAQGQLIGTPAYMSPEQADASSHDVDTRSDVYSLGVILFEMLGDRLPFDVEDKPVHKLLQAIADEEPRRLGTIDKSFRGDLEIIVAKALEKDRERRYQSAAELAGDVERYLRDEAIVARGPGARYQLRKFARRNRAVVIGALIGIVSLAVGAVVATVMAIWANTERESAQKSFAQSTAANNFIWNLLGQAGDGRANPDDVSLGDALDRAAKKLESESLDPSVERFIRHTIGYAYQKLWEFEKAGIHLRREHELLGQLRQQSTVEALENARNLAWVLLKGGKKAEGQPFIDEAMAIASAYPVDDPERIRTMAMYALYGAGTGKAADIERTWVDVVERATRVLGAEYRDTLGYKGEFALFYQGIRNYVAAESLMREIWAARKRKLGDYHTETLTVMNNLGSVLLADKRPDEAVEVLTEAFEGHKQTWGEDHHETVICQLNLLIALKELKRWDEVETLAKDMAPRAARMTPPDPFVAKAPIMLLARCYVETGRHEESLELLNSLIGEAPFEENSQQGAKALTLRGESLTQLGRHEEAQRDLTKANEVLVRVFPKGTDHLERAIRAMAELYDVMGKPELAAEWRAKLTSDE